MASPAFVHLSWSFFTPVLLSIIQHSFGSLKQTKLEDCFKEVLHRLAVIMLATTWYLQWWKAQSEAATFGYHVTLSI